MGFLNDTNFLLTSMDKLYGKFGQVVKAAVDGQKKEKGVALSSLGNSIANRQERVDFQK